MRIHTAVVTVVQVCGKVEVLPHGGVRGVGGAMVDGANGRAHRGVAPHYAFAGR